MKVVRFLLINFSTVNQYNKDFKTSSSFCVDVKIQIIIFTSGLGERRHIKFKSCHTYAQLEVELSRHLGIYDRPTE